MNAPAPSERRLLAWLRPLGLAYGPALLPFLVGPLGECGHCVRTYATMLPLVPGAIALLAPLPNEGRFALCGALTILVLGLAVLSQRAASPLRRRLLGGALALLIGLEALAFASLLRM